MLLLLMNTCGAGGSVALAGEQGVFASEELPGRGTSEHLLPAIRRLFAHQERTVAELTGIGVVDGPGSFTGVRVGLSAAKGLCDAAGCGMIAMSRLALVAAAAPEPSVLAVLDGGRGEFYCGLYRKGERVREALLREGETKELMQNAQAVTCEPRVAEALGAAVHLVPEPAAEEILFMMQARMTAGIWSDVATSDANYLRRTDAELKQAAR